MASPAPRRLLLVNPNTGTATTERLVAVLSPLLPAGWRLEAHTAAFGARYIACEASHAVAGHALLQAWAEHRQARPGPLEGVLIGCFGDPGLFALRESSACPVTGLAEASFLLAARRGPFAVVTGGERWKPMLQRLALALGHGDRLRHIETVAPSGAQLQADPDLALRVLGEACRAAASTGVESVILGGAGLAGYAARLQAEVPVPLLDSAQAGVQVLLEGLAPPPTRTTDGFVADWTDVAPAMRRWSAPPS